MKAKLLIITSLFCLPFVGAKAQSTPEAVLGLLPKAPTIDCNTESTRQNEAIAAYNSQLNEASDKIKEAIKKESAKNKNLQLSKNIKGQAVAQSGLSEEELKRASDKKTSQSEKDRLISKSVQSQTGFSMEEMQQVKKMSKADRQKWAMENFGKVTQKEQQKAEATEPHRTNNASMAKWAEEKQKIAQNLQYHYGRLEKTEQDLNTLAEQQKMILDNKLKQIGEKYKNVNDGENASKEDMRKIREKNRLVRAAKVEFCSKVTPREIDYLVNYESILKEYILPDLKRNEEIDYQISKQTFAKAEESSLERLQAIEKYASKLASAYDYYMSVDKID